MTFLGNDGDTCGTSELHVLPSDAVQEEEALKGKGGRDVLGG